jgi:hypothetical protein
MRGSQCRARLIFPARLRKKERIVLRFVIIIGFLGLIGYAAMWALATFVEPVRKPQTIIVAPELYRS